MLVDSMATVEALERHGPCQDRDLLISRGRPRRDLKIDEISAASNFQCPHQSLQDTTAYFDRF